uniref:Uncharacterized protein n=1 Tax=Cacopsylla melanoneura TaxID=428564 RepID=A0A8D8M7U4_9HEMI
MSSRVSQSAPLSSWNTSSNASNVHEGFLSTQAQPSNSSGDVCTRGICSLGLALLTLLFQCPLEAPTNLLTAVTLASEGPAACNSMYSGRVDRSSGHNWLKTK